MFRRVARLLGCLLISSPICASSPAKQHGISLWDLPSPAKSYELKDSGKVYEVGGKITPQRLITILPQNSMKHHPRLLGVCDLDGDSSNEVFITWTIERDAKTLSPAEADKRHTFKEPINIVRIYRVKKGDAAERLSEFQIEGQLLKLFFAKASTSSETNRVFLSTLGGAKWSTFYALSSDCKSVFLLAEQTTGHSPKVPGSAEDVWLDDLDGDGIGEWILADWRGEDYRCSYGFFGKGNYLEIFRPAPRGVRKIWPPKDWGLGWNGKQLAPSQIPQDKKYIVMNYLSDINNDGRDEIVALRDFAVEPNPGRTLSIYQLHAGSNSFTETASIRFPAGSIPVLVEGTRRLKDREQILLRFADPARCGDEGLNNHRGVVTMGGVDYKGGETECFVDERQTGYAGCVHNRGYGR